MHHWWKNQNKSKITWKKPIVNNNIILSTKLTLDKTGFLRTSPKDNETWIFDILVKEEDIPEDSKIIIYGYSDEYYTVVHDSAYGKDKVSTA